MIVTLYSRSFGKIKGVAKGVRGEGMARPGAYEPFTLLEAVFYEKLRSDLHLISEVSVLQSHESLRGDLGRLACAYYFAELVDQLTEFHDPHPPIFELLRFALGSLSRTPLLPLTHYFEVRLLHEIGLLPHLSGCVSCGERKAARYYFSTRQGGVFCQTCRQKSPEARLIEPRTLAKILGYMGEDSTILQEEREPGIEKGVAELIERFLLDRLGKRLGTRRFLSQVQFIKASRGGRKTVS